MYSIESQRSSKERFSGELHFLVNSLESRIERMEGRVEKMEDSVRGFEVNLKR